MRAPDALQVVPFTSKMAALVFSEARPFLRTTQRSLEEVGLRKVFFNELKCFAKAVVFGAEIVFAYQHGKLLSKPLEARR